MISCRNRVSVRALPSKDMYPFAPPDACDIYNVNQTRSVLAILILVLTLPIRGMYTVPSNCYMRKIAYKFNTVSLQRR